MKYLIALLTAATGIMHLLVGFHLIAGGGSGPGTNWLLVLNGIGYLVLLVLFWRASGNGGTIRWILLAYTLITLFGYFFMGAGFAGGTTPLVIKAIELLLAILLFLYRGPEPAVSAQPATRAATPKMDSSAADLSGVGSRMGSATGNLAKEVSTTATATAAGIGATVDRAEHAVADVAGDAVDAAEYAASEAADKAGGAVDAAKEAASEAVEYVEDKADAAYDAAAGAAGGAVDAAEHVASEAADAAGGAVDAARDAASETVEYVDNKASAAYAAAAGVVSGAAHEAHDAVDAAEGAVRSGVVAVSDAAGDAEGSAEAAVEDAPVDDGAHGDNFVEELREYFRTTFGSGSEYSKPIEYIEGIGAVYGQKLRAIDISTVLDLIVNGATRRGRKDLSDRSGISPSLILTWVNHVDLFRIKGVAQEYADLLEESGVDTVVELAKRNPANLHKRMIEVNEQKALVRRTPHASEVVKWVEQAKELRRVIHY